MSTRPTTKNSGKLAKGISFVIPAFNEVESIGHLIKEIQSVCLINEYLYEIIIVCDGSADSTWSEINRYSRHDIRIKGIKMARQFGKACALNAGFHTVHATKKVPIRVIGFGDMPFARNDRIIWAGLRCRI